MQISSVSGPAGSCSISSKPAYMPQDGDPVAASAARARNSDSSPSCRYRGRTSGALTKKFGRMKSLDWWDTSLRYAVVSAACSRQVKYV